MSVKLRPQNEENAEPEGCKLIRVVGHTRYFMAMALLMALISNAVSRNAILSQSPTTDSVRLICTQREFEYFFLVSKDEVICLTLLMSAVSAFLNLTRIFEKLNHSVRLLLCFVVGTSVGCCFTYLFDFSPPTCVSSIL